MRSESLRMGLVILLAFISWFIYTTRMARGETSTGRPPATIVPERIIQAPSTGSIVVRYGPADLVVETGSRVVLPGSGAFFGTEARLEHGRVRARVEKLGAGRHFAVKTFNCVAGVRGTEFVVSIVDGARTIVDVDHGAVLVTSLAGESVTVNAGQRSVVTEALLPELFSDPSAYQGVNWTLPPVEAFPPQAAAAPIPMEDVRERAPEVATARSHEQSDRSTSARAASSESDRRNRSLDPENENPVNVPTREIAPQSIQPRAY